MSGLREVFWYQVRAMLNLWHSLPDPRQRRQLEAWMQHIIRTGQPGADTFRCVLEILDRHARC
jgi:hypothetical protein